MTWAATGAFARPLGQWGGGRTWLATRFKRSKTRSRIVACLHRRPPDDPLLRLSAEEIQFAAARRPAYDEIPSRTRFRSRPVLNHPTPTTVHLGNDAPRRRQLEKPGFPRQADANTVAEGRGEIRPRSASQAGVCWPLGYQRRRRKSHSRWNQAEIDLWAPSRQAWWQAECQQSAADPARPIDLLRRALPGRAACRRPDCCQIGIPLRRCAGDADGPFVPVIARLARPRPCRPTIPSRT